MSPRKPDEGWEQGFWPGNRPTGPESGMPVDSQLQELARQTAPEDLISEERRARIMAEAMQALLPDHAHEAGDAPRTGAVMPLPRRPLIRRRWAWMAGAGLAASVLLAVWLVRPMQPGAPEIATQPPVAVQPKPPAVAEAVVTPRPAEAQPPVSAEPKPRRVAKTVAASAPRPDRAPASVPEENHRIGFRLALNDFKSFQNAPVPEDKEIEEPDGRAKYMAMAPRSAMADDMEELPETGSVAAAPAPAPLPSTTEGRPTGTTPSGLPQVDSDETQIEWVADENGNRVPVIITMEPRLMTMPNLDTAIPTLQSQLHNHARAAWRSGFTSIPATPPSTTLDARSGPLPPGSQVRVMPQAWDGRPGQVVRSRDGLWTVKSWKVWPVFSQQSLHDLKWLAAYLSKGEHGDAVVFSADDNGGLVQGSVESAGAVPLGLVLEVALTESCTEADCSREAAAITAGARDRLLQQYPDLIFVGETLAGPKKDDTP